MKTLELSLPRMSMNPVGEKFIRHGGHVAIGVPATIQKRKSAQPKTGETQDA
jgi:hypothetical protein